MYTNRKDAEKELKLAKKRFPQYVWLITKVKSSFGVRYNVVNYPREKKK